MAGTATIPVEDGGSQAVTFDRAVFAEERRVLGLALRLTGNAADAQDIAQEAFLRLHRNWAAVGQEPGVVAAWLRRVTVKLCMDAGRRARARRVVPTG